MSAAFPTFYGTSEETYYRTASGAIYCVQSPDLAATGGRPTRVDELPAGAVALDPTACHDLDVTGLDDAPALTAAEVRAAFPRDVREAQREAERLWAAGNNDGMGFGPGADDDDIEELAERLGEVVLTGTGRGDQVIVVLTPAGRVVTLADSHGPWAVDITRALLSPATPTATATDDEAQA